MKLLLDQNLSRRLLPELEPLFPGSSQVQLLGLEEASDASIWTFAREQGFAVVTKDADFLELSLLRGVPPKVVWLNLGNVPNSVLRARILAQAESISHFLALSEEGVLEIE